MAGAALRPAPPPARLAALAFIAVAHLLLLGAIALAGGTAEVIRHAAQPLFVQFVAPPPAQPSPPLARVPLPTMRAPQIRLPDAPAVEAAITLRQEERPAPPADPAPQAAAATPAPVPAQPPRFDLAYLNNPVPAYPPISRKLREEGRVVLRVLVNAAGLVDDIEMVATSGHARLDDAARAAVRRWKFVPARSGEHAVPGWALVPVAFNLQG